MSSTSVSSDKMGGGSYALPMNSDQKNNIEVHCMESVCIKVRIPSERNYSIVESQDESNSSLAALTNLYQMKKGHSDKETGAAEEKFEEPFELPSEEYLVDTTGACDQFLDIPSFSKKIIDELVEQFKPSDAREQDMGIRWPTIGSFSAEIGAHTIDEYLSYFDTEEQWMYVIYYQGLTQDGCCDIHKYQVIYSLPTWQYPIAQATASVFFTFEVCNAKPKNCLADITYRFETFRQIHRPMEADFKEKYLIYILDSKIKLFQTVTY